MELLVEGKPYKEHEDYEEYKRFFTKAVIDYLNENPPRENLRFPSRIYMRDVKETWELLEKESDGHNVSEAFRLFSETENLKEKTNYKRYYQKLVKEMKPRSKPLKWERGWDYE